MNKDYFDLILFENFHGAYRHKYDVYLIARLLQSKGMNVAILNIYKEDTCDNYKDVFLLDIPFELAIPNDSLWLSKGNIVKRLFGALFFLYHQHHYYKKVLSYVKNRAASFYCGSYHLMMPSAFFSLNKTCYYWGLRSYRMNSFKTVFRDNPILAIRMLYLKRRFIRNPKQKLFVSNEIIKDEFIKNGIPSNRLILRDERCVESYKYTEGSVRDTGISFLIIGGLRRQKNILFSIDAFLKANIHGAYLYLIGENSDVEYEERIKDKIKGVENIIRVNKRLDYKEFNEYFSKSHFTLFADEKGKSSITNGTMMESLMCYTPIIAPDYNPYSYYVGKYHIGLLYQPSNLDSYAATLLQASRDGSLSFGDSIKCFLSDITFDKVAQRLFDQIVNT